MSLILCGSSVFPEPPKIFLRESSRDHLDPSHLNCGQKCLSVCGRGSDVHADRVRIHSESKTVAREPNLAGRFCELFLGHENTMRLMRGMVKLYLVDTGRCSGLPWRRVKTSGEHSYHGVPYWLRLQESFYGPLTIPVVSGLFYALYFTWKRSVSRGDTTPKIQSARREP